MELKRINDVVSSYGVSSRTLRYYEELGLLWSIHPDNKSQRYYDAAALERLGQILVLRTLQIPLRDISEVFKNESTAALIQAFVNKLESLDNEISSLSELRKLVDDFLQSMLFCGIKKISAITLLYEETEKRLAAADATTAAKAAKAEAETIAEPEHTAALAYEKLAEVSKQASPLHDVRIIRLPPQRVLTSRHATGKAANLDGESMQNLFADYGLLSTPGMRDCFMRKEPGDEWVMLMRIPDDYKNETDYADEILPGGLYAVASTFFESMDDTLVLLREWVQSSDDFARDIERTELLEEILPWDIARNIGKFQQDLFIPIQPRSQGDHT